MHPLTRKPLLDPASEAAHTPPEIEELVGNPMLDDPSLGGGAPNAIFDAMAHYADDEPMSLPPEARMPQSLAFAGPGPEEETGSGSGSAAAPPKRSRAKPKVKKASASKKPQKQKYDWDKVRAATDDPSDPYDIKWIRKLDPQIRASIDGQFADANIDKRVDAKVKSDPQLKKLDADKKKAVAAAKQKAAAQLGEGINSKSVFLKSSGSVMQDDRNPTIATAEDEFAAKRAAREDAIRDEVENNANAGGRAQSIATPDGGKIRNADGQTLARANLMYDFTDLSKDPEKVKRHFQSMRRVKGTKDMMMGGDAATRFESARAAFELAHPGYTIPTSGNAFATRGLHQQRTNVGHLGHALGLAVDLDAVANPNLKGPDKEVAGVNAYMLGKFGRDRSKGDKPSRTGIDAVSEDTIVKMGQRTVGTLPSSAADKRSDGDNETALKTQFAQISATSERFKGENSLGKDAMTELRASRLEYFQTEEDKQSLQKLEKSLVSDPTNEDLLKRKTQLETSISDSELRIQATLADRFGGFQTELDGELVTNDAKAATTRKEIEDKEKERLIIQQTRDNFSDPARVFGGHHRNKKTNALEADLEVSNVPIMQYLEKGFIRDDKYDQPGSAKSPKAVFNGDTVAMLARYGFNPGSKFGDTMHFDFIEGYNDLIVGGRKAAENMRMDRASPENSLPTSPDGSPVNPLPPSPIKRPAAPAPPLTVPPSPVPPIQQIPLMSPGTR